MAYNMTDEEFVEHLIRNPDYCMFYHRARVRQLLPSLAKSYRLVDGLQRELEKKYHEDKNILKGDEIEIVYDSNGGFLGITLRDKVYSVDLSNVLPADRYNEVRQFIVDKGYVINEKVDTFLRKRFKPTRYNR